MTNAKDYISARTKQAEAYLPSLKEQLEQLIDESEAEFIINGEIAITKANLSVGISRFRAQSEELFDQLSDWLKEFGWYLVYKTSEKPDEKYYPNSPFYTTYYLVPEKYLHE